MKDQVLCKNEWVSLRKIVAPKKGIGGYVYSHESRCNGFIVAALPYRYNNDKVEYLLKAEITPCWSVDDPIHSSITGGAEVSNPRLDMLREIQEETGYCVQEDELICLGNSYASKSADTIYSLFSVNLTSKAQGEILGDGSRLEREAAAIWVSLAEILECKDPQVSVIYLRLQEYLKTQTT